MRQELWFHFRASSHQTSDPEQVTAEQRVCPPLRRLVAERVAHSDCRAVAPSQS